MYCAQAGHGQEQERGRKTSPQEDAATPEELSDPLDDHERKEQPRMSPKYDRSRCLASEHRQSYMRRRIRPAYLLGYRQSDKRRRTLTIYGLHLASWSRSATDRQRRVVLRSPNDRATTEMVIRQFTTVKWKIKQNDLDPKWHCVGFEMSNLIITSPPDHLLLSICDLN